MLTAPAIKHTQQSAKTIQIHPEDLTRTCPDCGSKAVVPQSGCFICCDCGWSPCKN